MASENETVANIVREMREDDVRIAAREIPKTEKLALSYACDWCKGFADRIEAAHRREVAELQNDVLRLKDIIADERAQHASGEARKNDEVEELRAALGKIYKCVDNKRGVDVSLLVKSIVADALGMVAERDASKPIAALLDSDLPESER